MMRAVFAFECPKCATSSVGVDLPAVGSTLGCPVCGVELTRMFAAIGAPRTSPVELLERPGDGEL